jgi:hypothetical protein
MKRALILTVVLAAAAVAATATRARGQADVNGPFEKLIQQLVDSDRTIRLSAQKIELAGDRLFLSGEAWVRFNDGAIRADEIVFDRRAKQVHLGGNVLTMLGTDGSRRLRSPESAQPR